MLAWMLFCNIDWSCRKFANQPPTFKESTTNSFRLIIADTTDMCHDDGVCSVLDATRTIKQQQANLWDHLCGGSVRRKALVG